MKVLEIILLIACSLVGLDIVLTLTGNSWWAYKKVAIKRKIWLAFGRCHRCNCKVNFTRSGYAVCPECGRRV